MESTLPACQPSAAAPVERCRLCDRGGVSISLRASRGKEQCLDISL